MTKRCLKNLMYELFFIVVISALFVMGRHQDCPIRINWVSRVALVIKGAVVIPLIVIFTTLLHFNVLKTNQLEMISSALAIPSSGWFCYITSLYFNPENTWRTDAKYLFYLHSLLALEAMWFFFKLCLIVIVLSWILVPMIVQNYLSWRRFDERKKCVKDKIMERESLNMSISKIDPEEFCIICMENYKPLDKVTRLPCTHKHFFHSKWIGDWISVSPKCPLCNTDIDASMSVVDEK